MSSEDPIDVLDEKRSSYTANTLAPQNTEINRGLSPAESRELGTRLTDDLELLRAERLVSSQEHDLAKTRSRNKERVEPEDAFNAPSKSVQEPKKDSDAVLYRIWVFLKKFPRFIRYFVYMVPGGCLLLIPILLGYFEFKVKPVGGPGGVHLMWFGIWLEVVWCSLWTTRIITSPMPWLFRLVASVFGSSNPKKWKDIGERLELHTALFLWFLAVLVSFLPIVNSHRVGAPANDPVPYMTWIDVVDKVSIALLVLATLNWVEKICIQWIATSFHQRTYATRIENNRENMAHLVHLYEFSKQHIAREDSIWKTTEHSLQAGSRTPLHAFQVGARHAWGKVGAAAHKLGNDIIGRKVNVNHPKKVVMELLRSSGSSHSLARLIYRSLVRPDRETVLPEDVQAAYTDPDESEACFAMFDKDLNGDISMDEFEIVCNEIHLEKKAIAASLKDLDSVIKKLDKVFLFIIFVIAAIVFVSIISGSAAAGLVSAGTSILGLAWMLQATAQEFLQSIIFVFVKHPFDVGDRVTIFNTGNVTIGDDYYVTSISLLYTEFKKMQGMIVQAPNSLLNTLFILNQRRSNSLADPISLVLKFGTSAEVIEELKARMLQFCLANKRDYQPRIITEVKTLDEMRSVTLNFVFFHKSNFQNELLRLTRHNKFTTELMAQMVDLGMQGPMRTEPGGSKEFPLYTSTLPPANDGQAAPLSRPGSPAGLFHQPSTRRHADSRIAPTIDENLEDFQDVYESRKEQNGPNVSRLSSIREKDKEGSSSSAALGRMTSKTSETSRGRRLFGHQKSMSKADASRANMV